MVPVFPDTEAQPVKQAPRGLPPTHRSLITRRSKQGKCTETSAGEGNVSSTGPLVSASSSRRPSLYLLPTPCPVSHHGPASWTERPIASPPRISPGLTSQQQPKDDSGSQGLVRRSWGDPISSQAVGKPWGGRPQRPPAPLHTSGTRLAVPLTGQQRLLGAPGTTHLTSLGATHPMTRKTPGVYPGSWLN